MKGSFGSMFTRLPATAIAVAADKPREEDHLASRLTLVATVVELRDMPAS